MIKVMVFGVFDGIHEGHRHFFKEAQKLGDHLIAVVAPDENVAALKGKSPKRDLDERLWHIKKEDGVNEAVPGDLENGSWDVIKKYRPDVVAVGYDQKELKENLKNSLDKFGWHLEIKDISAHEPEKYHSSLLVS